MSLEKLKNLIKEAKESAKSGDIEKTKGIVNEAQKLMNALAQDEFYLDTVELQNTYRSILSDFYRKLNGLQQNINNVSKKYQSEMGQSREMLGNLDNSVGLLFENLQNILAGK